jgi:hypothetical protein
MLYSTSIMNVTIVTTISHKAESSVALLDRTRTYRQLMGDSSCHVYFVGCLLCKHPRMCVPEIRTWSDDLGYEVFDALTWCCPL